MLVCRPHPPNRLRRARSRPLVHPETESVRLRVRDDLNTTYLVRATEEGKDVLADRLHQEIMRLTALPQCIDLGFKPVSGRDGAGCLVEFHLI